MSQKVKTYLVGGVRWAARLLALLVSGPFLYFLVFRSGEVVPNLSWRAPNEMPLLIAWLAVLAGILISWRWEMIGGLVTAIFGIAVGVLAFLGCGADELATCVLVSGPYLLTGLLLVGCCLARSERGSSRANQGVAA